MVDPLTIAAVGWGISIVGWMLSPFFNEVASYINRKISLKERKRDDGAGPSKQGVITAKRGKCIPKRTTADPPAMVIGRDEIRKEIVKVLRGKCYSVVCIHGIPGSGKTTLAQYVCKYVEDANPGYFHLVMWIHVSQNFRVGNIFREMYEQATGRPCPQVESLTDLQRKLKNKLRGTRFLLVLDDVWYKKDVSGEKLSPLEVGEAGSKILVTSRTTDALLALGRVSSRCYLIPELKDDAFRKLFMHYALDGAEMDDRDFKKIGREIAKKLKRSPLAARTVGGILRIRQDIEFWRGVLQGDLFKDTMGALRWSYEHLDEQARRCFAYCSIFPRGYRLRRDKLINLWVAEGFINRKEFQVGGGDCWHKLVATSFLQKGKGRRVEEYYLGHDLLYDLAETVAGSDYFRIEKGWEGQVPKDVRHLFIKDRNCNIGAMITDNNVKLKKLRTLIIDEGETSKKEFLSSIFDNLRTLRVLSVQIKSKRSTVVPKTIKQLEHLRYLAIGGTSTLKLPSTLTDLYHMRVLDFGGCGKLSRSSSENMSNLVNLCKKIGL